MIKGLVSYCKLALTNLWHHKVRGILAMIGILVGTASVVALLTGGQMATANALAQFKSLGTNLLSMDIVDRNDVASTNQKREFQLSDIKELKTASNHIKLIAPYINSYSAVTYHTNPLNSPLLGVTPTLYKGMHLKLQKGRFVTSLDEGRDFCMIGSSLAKQLKQYGVFDPIGKQINVGNTYETIVGVLQFMKPNFFFATNINMAIIVPLINTYDIVPNAAIRNILFRTTPNANFPALQNALKDKLSLMMPNKQAYFMSPTQILTVMSKQRQTFTWMLGMIGGIALLVGGIGVMNVMLMSVMERRQEIGIRIAVGATQRDILLMFLSEAVIQTVLGGILGVLLGLIISFIIALAAHWTFYIFILPPVIGFIVSVIVGLLAGFYPALRASRLDPIVTLRTA